MNSTDRTEKLYDNYKSKKIESVIEFIQWVNMDAYEPDSNIEPYFPPHKMYYRGQANDQWALKPGIFRDRDGADKGIGEQGPLDEHKLLTAASLKLWNEVSAFSYLDKMIFFQHYGLRTRLLDVTYNPLIALYMACSGKEESTGAVYCGQCIEHEDLGTAEATAKYVFKRKTQLYITDIQNFAKEEGISDVSVFQKPIFINPPINNPRIEAQDAALIMAPLLKNKKDERGLLRNNSGLEDSKFFNRKRVLIELKSKAKILKELFVLGIKGQRIFWVGRRWL